MVSIADVLKQKRDRAERADRIEVDWFSLKDNNPARIVFLQELDPDAPNFDSAKGSAAFLVEHVSPHNFHRKGLCSFETEGRCFGCEMAEIEPKPKDGSWWKKTNMYIQVFDAKDKKVKVLSRPAPGGFFDTLYEYAGDDNNGNVTGITFKIGKGPNKTDPWTLMPTNNKLEIPDGIQLDDMSKLGVTVEYDKQRNFYIPKGAVKEDTTADEAQASPPKPSEASLSW